MAPPSSSAAGSLLLRQFRELTDPRKRVPSFHIELADDNIFLWNIGVMVLNEDSVYHGGFFKLQMKFPSDFPFSPPTFRFTPPIYHPNVYRDGRLCISILHQGGDPTSDEPDSETWSPLQTVESVLISIVSLLEDPNISSPANVDAAVDWRKNQQKYKARVLQEVERSKQDIPKDFVMPTGSNTLYGSSRAHEEEEEVVDDEFWYDSEEEESFDDDESIMDDVEEADDDVDEEEDEEEMSEAVK